MFVLPLFEIQRFVFVFVRVVSIFMAAPVLSSRSIPVQLKMGLALVFTMSMIPVVHVTPSSFPESLPLLIMALGSEVLVGISIGLMARLVLTTVQVMGQLVGFQMGFGIVRVIDPATAQQVGVMSSFLTLFGILIFLTTNGHHLVFRGLAESFQILGPSQFSVSRPFMEILAKTFQNVFVIALKMGAPLFAVLLFTYAALGIIARTVPQINVFIAGFPLTISIGLVMLGLSLTHIAWLLREVFGHLGHDIVVLLEAI